MDVEDQLFINCWSILSPLKNQTVIQSQMCLNSKKEYEVDEEVCPSISLQLAKIVTMIAKAKLSEEKHVRTGHILH